MIAHATKCNITNQETLQPKNTHLGMCPGNVYLVHEHEKQRRKPARTPSPRPHPRHAHAKKKLLKICKSTHAIFNTSLTTFQDTIHQRLNEHALRDDCQQSVLQHRPQGQTTPHPLNHLKLMTPHFLDHWKPTTKETYPGLQTPPRNSPHERPVL